MGRAGGGGGSFGGGHGGGSFGGGSHHGGGFSGGGSFGGGRAGGGNFGGPRPRSSSGPRHSYSGYGYGPRPGYGYGPRPHRRGYRGNGGGAGSCSTLLLAILLILIVCALLGTASYSGTSYSHGGNTVTSSTIEREKLNSSSLIETEYYTDDAGYIYNSNKLEKGMKNFYKQTGVQPYLYVTDNIDGNTMPTQAELEAKSEELYDAIIPDEAHFFVLFVDSVDLEDAGQDFVAYYVVGNEARTVMDDEACEIVVDYITASYYDTSYSDWEDFLSAAYDKAGTRIMKVTVNPWVYVLSISGVAVIVVVGYKWWEKKRQAKKEEEERTDKILNTPLETYSSAKVNDEASDLAKKYQDTNKSQETAD